MLVIKSEDEVGRSTPSFTFRATYTYFSLRAGDLFVLPINMELGVVEGTFHTVLPALAGWDRTYQINALVFTIHQQIHFHL